MALVGMENVRLYLQLLSREQTIVLSTVMSGYPLGLAEAPHQLASCLMVSKMSWSDHAVVCVRVRVCGLLWRSRPGRAEGQAVAH